MPKAVFYQSIGPQFSRYDIDADATTLIKLDADCADSGAALRTIGACPRAGCKSQLLHSASTTLA